MIMYGGLDRNGRALGDMWYMDVDDQTEGKMFWILLGNTSASALSPAQEAALKHQIASGFGMPDAQGAGGRPSACTAATSRIDIVSSSQHLQFPMTLSIRFTTAPPVFDNCLKPVMLAAGAFERAVNGTALEGLLLDVSVQSVAGVVQELRMPWYWYRSNEYCKSGRCSRALCQSASTEAERESESDRYKYCYDDWSSRSAFNGDGVNEYDYQPQVRRVWAVRRGRHLRNTHAPMRARMHVHVACARTQISKSALCEGRTCQAS